MSELHTVKCYATKKIGGVDSHIATVVFQDGLAVTVGISGMVNPQREMRHLCQPGVQCSWSEAVLNAGRVAENREMLSMTEFRRLVDVRKPFTYRVTKRNKNGGKKDVGNTANQYKAKQMLRIAFREDQVDRLTPTPWRFELRVYDSKWNFVATCTEKHIDLLDFIDFELPKETQ